ncbi:MAG: hypothetical protein WCE62_10370 [Polyangiales bacterium]
MRRQGGDGAETQPVWLAWIVTLACVGMAGLAPNGAEAQDSDADPVSQEALSKAQQELNAAQAKLNEAQAQLDEAVKTLPPGVREPTAEEEDDPVDPDDDSVDVPEPVGPGLVSEDGEVKKLQWALNKDGTRYFRMEFWLQVWTRAIQLNPGTVLYNTGDDPETPEVEGDKPAWYGDVAIRRARALFFGEIFPRVLLLMHFGINNQTFRRSNFKETFFFHDLWAEFAAIREHLYIGGGLIYWNGISRMTNASTITFLTMDAPISNWPTIEETDQFARQLGLYAKGKANLFDYRVAVTKPFQSSVNTVTTMGNYNPYSDKWAYAGYFQLQFWDIESNVLPYTTGTYLGTKRVMNLGSGFYSQPKGIAYLDANGDVKEQALTVASADFFVDLPLKAEHGGAITAYGAYYWLDFGPNNLRNIGIMNPGAVGSGIQPSPPGSGPGNQYPMLGTGNTGYGQLGWLMPWKIKILRFQPYILSQMSKFDGLNDMMVQFAVGMNMFIYGHNAKVTLEYRNRPIFDAARSVESRAGNAFILQMQLAI